MSKPPFQEIVDYWSAHIDECDIAISIRHSLKVLDPKRPMREADIAMKGLNFRS